MNINTQKISSALSNIVMWLLTCFISLGLIAFFFILPFANLDLDDKAYCLETRKCAEGLEINTEHGLILINEENCLKYGYEWSGSYGDYCDLRAKEKITRPIFEAISFEVSWILGTMPISESSTLLFFIFLPLLLLLHYVIPEAGPPKIILKIWAGVSGSTILLSFLTETFSLSWSSFFGSLLNISVLILFWIILFKKMKSYNRIFALFVLSTFWILVASYL